MARKERLEIKAKKYATETQEFLNNHLGIEIIPAWGVLSSAWLAGAHFVEEEVKEIVEAINRGAFHHYSCNSYWYADGTVRDDYSGYGDPRKPKPCTCSKKLIEEALKKYENFIST